MSRYSLRLVFYTFVFGFTLVTGVLAQDETPTPSVDDAVSTLLAQTQQAPTQIFVTQTVQAALEGALTATAQAATPIPLADVDVSTINVASVTRLDLVAGPGNRSALLAPDGRQFVHSAVNSLCLYEATTEVRCVDLEAYEVRLDPETIRWSLDSRYIAFTEDFFRFLHDPDIWLWDTTTDTLNNLTDDGERRISLAESDDFEGDIDLLPTWLPDGSPTGTLTFLRYPNRTDRDTVAQPEIYTISLDGNDLTQVGTLSVEDNWAVYSMSAFGNQLMYIYAAAKIDNPNNGIWLSDSDGSSSEQIVAAGGEIYLHAAGAYPSGTILVNNPASLRIGDFSPETSAMQLADIETGKVFLIDSDRFVSAAGWSPDGELLAYTVRDRENEENNGLYITDTPGEPGRMILAGMFISPTPRQELPLIWGVNNTILLSQQDADFNLLLVELGIETQ